MNKELKAFTVTISLGNPNGELTDKKVCLKDEVDALLVKKDEAIAELKQELDKAIAERDGNQVCIDALKAEIKRKEGVGQRRFEQCMEARTESVRLKRALLLAREWRAWCEGQFWFIIDSDKPKDIFHLSCTQRIHRTPNEWMDYWQNVERKCRAKAEEYK